MNLIKIMCGMLALALVLGILTGGGSDSTAPENPGNGPENETVEENGISEEAGETLASAEAQDKAPVNVKSIIPKPPAPEILKKGKSEISAQKWYIETRLKATARSIEENGEEIFPEFKEEGSIWFRDDFYIFVWGMDGTQMVYPPDSSREGLNMKELEDSDGKPIGELFLEIARSEAGEGWIEYSWPRPGSSKPARKHSFIKRISGKEQTYLIGAGFYVDDLIHSKNLEDCELLKREGNIVISELLHPKNLDREIELNYSISHAAIKPGESIAPHMMNNSETFYILEGKGVLYLDGISVELRPEQIVYVPAGSVQTTYNTGNTSLRVLVINQPAWDPENEEILE